MSSYLGEGVKGRIAVLCKNRKSDILNLHQLNCTDNVFTGITDFLKNESRSFVIRKPILLRYYKITTKELTFISTELKVHLYAGLFTSWGEMKMNANSLLASSLRADFKT